MRLLLLVQLISCLVPLYLCAPTNPASPNTSAPHLFDTTGLVLTGRKTGDYGLMMYIAYPETFVDPMMHIHFKSLLDKSFKQTPAHHLSLYFSSVSHGYVEYATGHVVKDGSPKACKNYRHTPLTEAYEASPQKYISNRREDAGKGLLCTVTSLDNFLIANPLKKIDSSTNLLGLFVLFVDTIPSNSADEQGRFNRIAAHLDKANWALLIITSSDTVDPYTTFAGRALMKRRLVAEFSFAYPELIVKAAQKFIQAPDDMDLDEWVPEILPHYLTNVIPYHISKHATKQSLPPVSVTFFGTQKVSRRFQRLAENLYAARHLSGIINILVKRYGIVDIGDVHENYNLYLSTRDSVVAQVPLQREIYAEAPLLKHIEKATFRTLPLTQDQVLEQIIKRYGSNPNAHKEVQVAIILCDNCGGNISDEMGAEFARKNIAVLWVNASDKPKTPVNDANKKFPFRSEEVTLNSEAHLTDIVVNLIKIIDDQMFKIDAASPTKIHTVPLEVPIQLPKPVEVGLLLPRDARIPTIMNMYHFLREGLKKFREGVNLHITADIQYGVALYESAASSALLRTFQEQCVVKVPIQKMTSGVNIVDKLSEFLNIDNPFVKGTRVFEAIHDCVQDTEDTNPLGWTSSGAHRFLVVWHDQPPTYVSYNTLLSSPTGEVGHHVHFDLPTSLAATNKFPPADIIILTYPAFVEEWEIAVKNRRSSPYLYTIVPISTESDVGSAVGLTITKLLKLR